MFADELSLRALRVLVNDPRAVLTGREYPLIP